MGEQDPRARGTLGGTARFERDPHTASDLTVDESEPSDPIQSAAVPTRVGPWAAPAERGKASKLAQAAIPRPVRDEMSDRHSATDVRAVRHRLMEERTSVSGGVSQMVTLWDGLERFRDSVPSAAHRYPHAPMHPSCLDDLAHIDSPSSQPGARIVGQAEMDLYVGLTACSAEKFSGGLCKYTN